MRKFRRFLSEIFVGSEKICNFAADCAVEASDEESHELAPPRGRNRFKTYITDKCTLS